MEPAFASKGHHVSVPDAYYVDYDTFEDDDDDGDDDEGNDDDGDDDDGDDDDDDDSDEYLCISAS